MYTSDYTNVIQELLILHGNKLLQACTTLSEWHKSHSESLWERYLQEYSEAQGIGQALQAILAIACPENSEKECD